MIVLRWLLFVLSIPIFSRLYGRFARIKRPRVLVRAVIRLFKEHFQIDMDQYRGKAEDYPSLAAFFVRPLDPEKRPLPARPDAVVSPADGTLESIATIYEDKAAQVKGSLYKVSDLVCDTLDFSSGWHIATIYLSPSDYHRFHYPLSASLEAYCHTRGSLYPVNALGTRLVKRLFVKNERIIARFRLEGQPVYMAAVGATFVGSIRMNFIHKIKRDNQWKTINRQIKQLEEMGRFDMGSTIILVLPQALAAPLPTIKPGQPINVGDPLFLLSVS